MKNTTIIVIRFSKGAFKNSKPCKNCLECMVRSNVKYIAYSVESGDIVKELVKNVKTTHISNSGKLLEPELYAMYAG